MKQRVILLDELGEKFGSVHEYHNLRTPADAIRLLIINYPKFQKELLESSEKGVAYKVIQSETEFDLEDMLLPFGSKDLIITPVIAGSGSAGRVLLGVGLVALAIGTGGLSAFGMSGFTAAGITAGSGITGAAAAAIAIGGNVGIALTLGGITQMLSPQPQEALGLSGGSNITASGPGSIVRGSNGTQSYAYRGAVNSVGAGATIPVVFGKALIGSHILSADIEITDESDPLNEYIRVPDPDTIRVQGEELDSTWSESARTGMKSLRLPESRTQPYSGWTSVGGTMYLRPFVDDGVEIDIDREERQKIDPNFIVEMEGADAYDQTEFQIAFRLNNGLYNEIGGEGTTKVDGFITFGIIVRSLDENEDVSQVSMTVQGLMSPSQSYSWVSWFTIGKIPGRDNYALYILPIDHSADIDINTLEVIEFGYRFVPLDL